MLLDLDYDEIINRIQSVYASCSPMEQKQLLQILQEVSAKGYSETMENLWLTDFKEVPVSIDRFLTDPYFLGPVTRNGEAIYPYWRNMMNNVFNHGNQYNEIILSGATRIGKTSTMVTIMAYMLYRLMLYRNPHEYFKKKEISKFTLGFANLNEKLAFGVAYRELQDTLREVPFFNDHGSFTRSDRNFYYIPEGDKIEIIAGSDSSHFLGKQMWCLVGETSILTIDGIRTLAECAGSYQVLAQYTGSEIKFTVAYVAETKRVTETIRIELEDGTIIEGTPEHKVLLTDHTYKALGDLSEFDEILDYNITEAAE